MTPEQVLEDAIRVIERDGWHQGSYFKEPDSPYYTTQRRAELARTAPVCAMGAIFRAASGTAMLTTTLPCSQEAIDAVVEAEARLKQVVGKHVPHFNDDEHTTKEDVILAMKKAAHGD